MSERRVNLAPNPPFGWGGMPHNGLTDSRRGGGEATGVSAKRRDPLHTIGAVGSARQRVPA